ncbi:hypothetical protein GOODEAATRI_006773 [Goodea atripinnis]|uniref:Bromo domain-containing protein n=1 Tax=Goodea atripinnis TaxID=208336 RepID=A0ABV0PW50_9TELE
MRSKLEGHAYCSIGDLEKDFELMISNCLSYNSKDTMFHKTALQLGEVGGAILRHAQRQYQSIGLDPSTGMHLPEAPNKHGFYQCTWEDDDSPPVLELTCPVSSPLPGDAPLEPPVLGIVIGGQRSPGRSYKRQRSSLRGSKSQGEDEAEVGETPSSQPEAVHEVTPLGTPPTLPLVGVGRRTSVLFKKAKNGARKNKCSQWQNGKTSDEKTNGLDGTAVHPNSPSVNITTLPPTPNASPEPSSPSSHQLRSRGPSSESEHDKPPAPPKEEGKAEYILTSEH